MSIKKTMTLTLIGMVATLMGRVAAAQEEDWDLSPVDDHIDEASDADSETAADSGTEGGGLKLERPLLLTRHTMQLGGSISLAPVVDFNDQPGADNAGGGVFTLSPTAGYFVIDYLEILFEFGLEVPFGDARAWWDVTIGFGFGARYFFDFDVVALYVGGMLGPSFEIPDNEDADVRKYFDIGVLLGVLLPLNRHVGVDLGMRFDTHIFLGGGGTTTLSIPMGYLGVDAFFNLFTGG